jgi:putative phosphoesterase
MTTGYHQFMPSSIDPDRVQACLGLISDTHMPQRCAALPPALADVFRGVDLILHAGDLGELWVLDKLSAIAPVIAVHGNDETVDAQRELPYQQIITIAGQRLLLYHRHHPDHAQEMALRQDDRWQPKLERWAAAGQRAGASTVVFGHAHIPMAVEQHGVLLINPGAIASGSAVSRQTHQTVALLFIVENERPVVTHIDLAAPRSAYVPYIDWGAGYRAALDRYSASILAPDLAARWPAVDKAVRHFMNNPAQRAIFDIIYEAVLRKARPCWEDSQQFVTLAAMTQVLAELRTNAQVPAEVVSALEAAL